MKQKLDMDKIAKGLGARRVGTVRSSGGYFGAMQLAGEVAARFRVPQGVEELRTPAGRSVA